MRLRPFNTFDRECFAEMGLPIRNPRQASPMISADQFFVEEDPAVMVLTADGMEIHVGLDVWSLSCTFTLALLLADKIALVPDVHLAEGYLKDLGFEVRVHIPPCEDPS
jgi:hypothetical protein